MLHYECVYPFAKNERKTPQKGYYVIKKHSKLRFLVYSCGIQFVLCAIQFIGQYNQEVNGILCPISMGTPGVWLAFYPLYNGVSFTGWQYMGNPINLIVNCALFFGAICFIMFIRKKITHSFSSINTHVSNGGNLK